MLIRTQDKERLVNLDNIISIYTERISRHGEIQERYITNIKYHAGVIGGISLGTYSSEEKAIKVLDKIQELYSYGCFDVFEMPSDDEVNV